MVSAPLSSWGRLLIELKYVSGQQREMGTLDLRRATLAKSANILTVSNFCGVTIQSDSDIQPRKVTFNGHKSKTKIGNNIPSRTVLGCN